MMWRLYFIHSRRVKLIIWELEISRPVRTYWWTSMSNGWDQQKERRWVEVYLTIWTHELQTMKAILDGKRGIKWNITQNLRIEVWSFNMKKKIGGAILVTIASVQTDYMIEDKSVKRVESDRRHVQCSRLWKKCKQWGNNGARSSWENHHAYHDHT